MQLEIKSNFWKISLYYSNQFNQKTYEFYIDYLINNNCVWKVVGFLYSVFEKIKLYVHIVLSNTNLFKENHCFS